MALERRRQAENGITVYDYLNSSLNSFYISLFVKAGSMYESARDNGITHFLEHAVIRNVNALMEGGLYAMLDECGIEFNASTYSEMVQFYVHGAKEKFQIGARIISMVLSPIILTPSDVRAECERIKAEIRENDERGSLSNFTAAIVHEGTSLSRPIIGTASGVSKISARRLEEYRRATFTRENLFVYVTGAYGDSELDSLVRLIGESEVLSSESRENMAPVPPFFGKRDGRVQVKNGDFTMMRFTFDMDMSKISVPESDLIYDLLLGGYNSRFFIEMSEKRGLFYDISGSTERYSNIGSLSFSFEVRAGSVYEATELLLSLLSQFKEEILPEEKMMKAGYVDNAGLLLDDPRELNFTFAYDNHILCEGYRTLDERAERYRAVTPERLRLAARELFKKENLTLTVKGKRKSIDTRRLEEMINKFA